VGRAAEPIRHGTNGGYQVHMLRGSEPCEACRAARRDYGRRRKQEQRARGKCARGLGWPVLSAREAGRG